MIDFTNTYDAFMHCDVNKLAEAFASMYHSDGEECDRLGCAKQEVNEAFMRMKTITPKVETNQSILLVCKDFGDTGDDVSLIKAKDLSVWKGKHKEKAETISDEMLTFIFRTKEELEGLRCSLEERKKILASRPHTFEGWQKMFITYTLAWESDNLWKIVLYILDNMCGAPYNAEHTIYEFLMGTKKTRENFEVVFENNTQELNITPSTTEKFKQVVITHNNPFGKVNDYDKAEMLPDHQNTLYIFGHIPHKEIVRIDRPNSNCTYLDIDTSIESVSVIKLSVYLR